MNSPLVSYKRQRFPPRIIAHAVWLYFRFNLSLREVEGMLLQRGGDVSYETVRRWVIKFGPRIARTLRQRQGRPSDVWHLDEVVVQVSGRKYWLWRTVGQHGVVLDEILRLKRDTRATKRLLRSLIKRLGFIPKRIITYKLRSYGAARQEIARVWTIGRTRASTTVPGNSHLPFRKRERAMRGSRFPGGLQRFVATHTAIRNYFCAPARRRPALTIRYHRLEAFDAWNAATRAA